MLIRVQGNICGGCGKPMKLKKDCKVHDDDRPTTDHVLPRGRGGMDAFGNVIAMHEACNNMKGDDMPTGCELIWLIAVNCRLGVEPMKW